MEINIVVGLVCFFLGVLTGGYYVLKTNEAGIKTALSLVQNNLLRMAAALEVEWETHKKKRSGLIERNDDLEFVLTIRPKLQSPALHDDSTVGNRAKDIGGDPL